MILFEEDWLKMENAGPEGLGPIVDTQTKNTSFLNYASLLHQMGIKNWAFCLALHDPKLQGIDPFDENLSEEMMFRVGIELEANPWYYLRECALVPSKAGADAVKFRAHRANMGMFWLFMNNVSFFLLQPRQTGKSVVADMINNYLLHYRMHKTNVSLVTLSQTLLIENMERIKAMRELLPQYTIARTKNDTKAKEQYTYPAKGNKLITMVSQSSEMGATKVGRGCSVAVQQFDEAAFIGYMDVVWAAAVPGTGAARDLARERGEPYGTMITTTAGDKMTRSGKFMYDIYESTADWTEHYFDLKNKAELHEVVKRNSKDHTLMVGATFNHLQLGYSDEWLSEKIRELKNVDQDQINRDYFNIWTAGGALSPLSPDITQNILMSEKQPDYVQITKAGYIIKWYIPREQIGEYMRNNTVVMGMDTSEAINRDAISFVAVDVTTLKTVAVMGVSEADTIKLAKFMVDFLVSFPRITLIIEHKSTATTFIETLYTQLPLHGIDPFRRLYNTIVQEPEQYPELFRQIQTDRNRRDEVFYTKNKKKFGFNQTAATRHLLYKTVLEVSAKRCQHVIYDKTLSNEMRSLEVDPKSGRIDHDTNGHDDHVIAWLLAMWLLIYGRNLSFYGIESRRVMTKVSDEGEEVPDVKVRERELIDAYYQELDALANKLIDCEGTIYAPVIEAQMRQINMKLTNFGVEPKTIDALRISIKEQRQEEKRLKRINYQ